MGICLFQIVQFYQFLKIYYLIKMAQIKNSKEINFQTIKKKVKRMNKKKIQVSIDASLKNKWRCTVFVSIIILYRL